MDHRLHDIALRRLGIIAADPAAARSPHLLAAYTAELARVGIRIVNPDALTDDVLRTYPTVRAAAVSLRGADRIPAPLFDGFPDRLPAADDARLRFYLYALRLLAFEPVASDERGVWFSDDDMRAARDLSAFGWWPASSVPQDIDTATVRAAAQELLDGDDRTEWIDVRVMPSDAATDALRDHLVACAYSRSSLRAEVADELRVLLDVFGSGDIRFDEVTFGEIRALLVARLFAAAADGDDTARRQLVDAGLSPDDVLRLFAALTGTDTSLQRGVRFPALRRPQRKLILTCLEASPRLRDVFRRRGLWLAAARSLHVGEHADRYPRCAAVFAELRTCRYDRESTAARFEAAIADGDAIRAAGLLADEAPGLLLRHLRRVAAHAGGGRALDADVARAAARAPLRVLLAVRAQLADNGATYPRLAITKTGRPMLFGTPGHLALDADDAARLVAVLDTAIAEQLAARGSWAGEKVWVDDATRRLGIPDQLRTSSDGQYALDRGSRVALGDAPVLRLFVHWMQGRGQRSDLDLSLLALDDNFDLVRQVSWTNLAEGAMTHSGDLTSAPAPVGAAEFIDVRLDAVRETGWRYLAPAIFRFAGPHFGQLQVAQAGWMLRDKADSSRATFDPKTVANAFALTGTLGTALPFVYDVATGDIVYLDVYIRSLPRAQVERDARTVGALARGIVARGAIRPTLAELAFAHAAARGAQVVTDRADATITVGLDDDATYNALRPQKLLAELL